MIFQTRFFKNQVQSNRGKFFFVCFEQFSSQTFLVKQRFSNLTSQKSIPAFNFPKFESGKKVSHVYFLNSFKLFSITWAHSTTMWTRRRGGEGGGSKISTLVHLRVKFGSKPPPPFFTIFWTL